MFLWNSTRLAGLSALSAFPGGILLLCELYKKCDHPNLQFCWCVLNWRYLPGAMVSRLSWLTARKEQLWVTAQFRHSLLHLMCLKLGTGEWCRYVRFNNIWGLTMLSVTSVKNDKRPFLNVKQWNCGKTALCEVWRLKVVNYGPKWSLSVKLAPLSVTRGKSNMKCNAQCQKNHWLCTHWKQFSA